MDVEIEKGWKSQLKNEFDKPYFNELVRFVKEEYSSKTIYPPSKLIFNAFNSTPFNQVKVVIVGQDPYHQPHQAHGLCFSVNDGIRIPPSLVNIYKEINLDLGTPIPTSGNLERWAKQGILLLNATLTVRAGSAGSHQGKGWEQFTDSIIDSLSSNRNNLVFMLWGSYAQKKGATIDQSKHLVMKSVHPSPLSAHRGFFGNKHFSRANEYLISKGKSPIEW
jgi:uracil-DNA glycosylase